MVERRDIATWLEGPGGRRNEPGSYAGQRLGLPEHGRGAVAGFGSRIVAYLIDSGACALIAYGLLRDQQLTLLIFAVEVLALTWLAAGSAGQLAYGLRVVRLDGAPIGLPRAALRTLLLCLADPGADLGPGRPRPARQGRRHGRRQGPLSSRTAVPVGAVVPT